MINKVNFPDFNDFGEFHNHEFKFVCNGIDYSLRCYPLEDNMAAAYFRSDIVIALLKNGACMNDNYVWGFNRETYPTIIEKCKEILGLNGGC